MKQIVFVCIRKLIKAVKENWLISVSFQFVPCLCHCLSYVCMCINAHTEYRMQMKKFLVILVRFRSFAPIVFVFIYHIATSFRAFQRKASFYLYISFSIGFHFSQNQTVSYLFQGKSFRNFSISLVLNRTFFHLPINFSFASLL